MGDMEEGGERRGGGGKVRGAEGGEEGSGVERWWRGEWWGRSGFCWWLWEEGRTWIRIRVSDKVAKGRDCEKKRTVQ